MQRQLIIVTGPEKGRTFPLEDGQTLLIGNSLPELIRRVRVDEPRRPKEFQLSVNDMFEKAVMRMIAKRPEAPYDTPADLLRDLERIGCYHNVEADWGEWVG